MDNANRGNRWNNTSGAILVETAVSFAVTAILMCTVIAVLAVGLRSFGKIQTAANAELVSELLLDKITEEIAAAGPGTTASGSNWSFLEGNKEETTLYTQDTPAVPAAAWLAFENGHGIPVAVYAAEEEEWDDGMERGSGYLYIRYYDCGNESAYMPENGFWQLDPKLYLGFRISRLLFSRPHPEIPNVFRIDLELEHERTGWRYASCRYTKNRNLPGDRDGVMAEQGDREPESVEEWPNR